MSAMRASEHLSESSTGATTSEVWGLVLGRYSGQRCTLEQSPLKMSSLEIVNFFDFPVSKTACVAVYNSLAVGWGWSATRALMQ